MEHPAVAEAGVIGIPDPIVGEVVKAFVALKAGSRRRARSCARNCSATRASGSARRSRRRRSPSARISARPAAARSCAGCSRRANSACPKATSRHWRATSDEPHRDKPHLTARACARPPQRDDPHPPLRGEVRRTVQRGEDPRLPASLDRRGGHRGRRHAGAGARRRGGGDLSRARPRAGARHVGRTRHGGDVRQDRGLQPRARRLDAHVRRGDPLLWRQRHRRRRPAARGRSRPRRSACVAARA